MIKVTFAEQTYECARAVKGVNYIRLYNENNILTASFEGVSDTTQFIIKGGEWEDGVSNAVVTCPAVIDEFGVVWISVPQSVCVETGLTINFIAPCASESISTIVINDASYDLNDINDNLAMGIAGAFKQGAAVSIKINSNTQTAYLQTPNAAPVAPMYSYGTGDLEAGASPLETGKLYFVYE